MEKAFVVDSQTIAFVKDETTDFLSNGKEKKFFHLIDENGETIWFNGLLKWTPSDYILVEGENYWIFNGVMETIERKLTNVSKNQCLFFYVARKTSSVYHTKEQALKTGIY